MKIHVRIVEIISPYFDKPHFLSKPIQNHNGMKNILKELLKEFSFRNNFHPIVQIFSL